MRSIQNWLLVLLLLVASIVVIGGITRLTGSGLSMVDWQPIMGILPPLTDSHWADLFSAYKQSPEYQKINMGIHLSEFKFIFFWEYIHRIFGRIIGLVAIFPFAYFAFKKKLPKSLLVTWPFIIFLIGCQGLMGWYMVKSGLIDNPHVSHFRLAAHLSLAFIIFILIFWQYLKLQFPYKKRNQKTPILLSCISVGIGIQIVYGAFMAGLHAGYYYNNYPKMGDEWIPESIFLMNGLLKNILENPIMIQWIHRWLAVGILIGVIIIWKQYRIQNANLRKSSSLLLGVMCFQFILGILTLITKVSLPIAVAHQFGALCLLISLSLVFYFKTYDKSHL